MKKWSILLAFILVFALLAGCQPSPNASEIKKDEQKTTDIYNAKLGKTISLGMTKNSVDELLGLPEEVSYEVDTYFYGDLLVVFSEDALISAYVSEAGSGWTIYGGIGVASTEQELTAALGDPGPSFVANTVFYTFDKDGKSINITETPEADTSHSLVITLENSKITSVYLGAVDQ